MILRRKKLIRTKQIYPLSKLPINGYNKATFKLDYSDGTTEFETVIKGSVLYNKYTCKKYANG